MRTLRTFSLLAALLTLLSLPAHEAFTHAVYDGGCQVCSVSHSPELNADCGSALLSAPENFKLRLPVFSGILAASGFKLVFQGRAPPWETAIV